MAMIRTEAEYRDALKRLKDARKRVAQYRKKFAEEGLTPRQVGTAVEAIETFHAQIEEDVQLYERLRRGELDELRNLHGLGQSLVALRIASGLTQRELAKRLGVHVTQISRDERNEYHGISVDRASKVLEALGAELVSRYDLAKRLAKRRPRQAHGLASRVGEGAASRRGRATERRRS